MSNLSSTYHWNTSLQFGSELVDRERIRKTFLHYNEFNIENSDFIDLFDSPLKEFTDRKTIRDFKDNSTISKLELSIFLTNSIKQTIKTNYIYSPTPSAGGLYPIKTYLLINRVTGITRGVYLYNNTKHCLEFLYTLDDLKEWENVFLNQSFVMEEKFSVAFIFMLDMEKISCKYDERGYRYALLEAGHICQNLQLISTRLDIPSVPVGGYIDNTINNLLNLDINNFLPIYAFFLGGSNKKFKGQYNE